MPRGPAGPPRHPWPLPRVLAPLLLRRDGARPGLCASPGTDSSPGLCAGPAPPLCPGPHQSDLLGRRVGSPGAEGRGGPASRATVGRGAARERPDCARQDCGARGASRGVWRVPGVPAAPSSSWVGGGFLNFGSGGRCLSPESEVIVLQGGPLTPRLGDRVAPSPVTARRVAGVAVAGAPLTGLERAWPGLERRCLGWGRLSGARTPRSLPAAPLVPEPTPLPQLGVGGRGLAAACGFQKDATF